MTPTAACRDVGHTWPRYPTRPGRETCGRCGLVRVTDKDLTVAFVYPAKDTLTDDEKRALSITLKFRIDQLKAIETQGNAATPRAREQIDYLVSAAIKLALP